MLLMPLSLSLSESSERRHTLFHLTSDSHLTASTAAPAALRSSAKRTYVNSEYCTNLLRQLNSQFLIYVHGSRLHESHPVFDSHGH